MYAGKFAFQNRLGEGEGGGGGGAYIRRGLFLEFYGT